MYQNPKVLSLLLIFTAVSLPAAYSEDTVRLKVFILAGQSNMVGQGRPEELPKNQQNVRVMGRNGRLVPMNVQGRFGPEVSFAQEIAEAWPDETIVLIKHARGRTCKSQSTHSCYPMRIYYEPHSIRSMYRPSAR